MKNDDIHISSVVDFAYEIIRIYEQNIRLQEKVEELKAEIGSLHDEQAGIDV